MRKTIRIAAGAGLAGLLALAAPLSASAAPGTHGDGADHVVFVQTDNPSGNQVVAYDRSGDGTLGWAASYATGGNGGILNGSAVDHLASQGGLAYDADAGLLLAVNAGSDTLSVFSVDGDHLRLRQVVDSGGTFPVSIAVSGDLVYVLNALDGGDVAGFRIDGGRLHPIHGSVRSL
ncbi:MAG TPA: beta-propeller fold lactonase family protein, partial [Actinomycetota bacterium]|nr:beta-propeller fold lactonase family protein [Actinomycetota bacterium]